MTVSPITWPRPGLPPRKVTAEVVPATTSGGRSITAVEQVVSFDAGFWNIILDEIPIASRIQKLLWRSIASILDGRDGLCDVPIYDTDGSPWPTVNGKFFKAYPAVPHSDDAYFSDGAGYLTSVISATITRSAAAGAVRVNLDVANAGQVLAGQHFSVLGASGLTHLYRIRRIDARVGGFLTDDSGTILTDDDGIELVSGMTRYTVLLNLPLREAVTEGQTANFDDPRCTCRLETDREMFAGVDDYAGRTLARVSFVEVINV